MCKKAFSFLEMVIVLSVVSLLILMVIYGQKIKSYSAAIGLGNDIYTFQASVINFHNKYNALPGDMVDAYNIWGTMCAATAGACIGDGDMRIDSAESGMALIHLSLEELLSYGNINNTSFYRLDYPAQAELYYKSSTATVSGRTYYADVLSKNILEIGEGTSRLPFISAEMAQKIDYKLDDGLPQTGNLTAVEAGTNICVDTTNNIYYDNTDTATASASQFECSFAVPILF